MLVAVIAAHNEHAPDFFSQVATIRISQERIDRRTGVRDQPAFLLLGGGGSRGITHGLRQTGEVGVGLERDKLAVFFGQNVLTEFGEEAGELLIDLREPRFVSRVQLRAGSYKVGVVEPNQSLLLWA